LKLTLYANLLRLLLDSEEELGISGLTESDRQVLLSVVEISKSSRDSNCVFKLKYESVISSFTDKGIDRISKTQFFRSIKKLESLQLIRKVGGERSSNYVLLE